MKGDEQIAVLQKEIGICEKKKRTLKRPASSLTKDFVEFIIKAASEDPEKMREVLLKGGDVKREAEKSKT